MDSSLFVVILFGIVCVACLLPMFFLMGLIVLAITQAQKVKSIIDTIVIPDQSKLRQQFHQLQAENPDASVDVLVEKIIKVQSLKSGIVGLIIGFGGLIAVPFNVGASIRLQASTIHLIAYAYGTDEDDETLKRTTYLIMTGNQAMTQAAQVGVKFLQPLLLQIVGRTIFRSLVESIPIFSSIVGLAINVMFTYYTGQLAIKWYTNPNLQQKAKGILSKGENLLDQGLLKIVSSGSAVNKTPNQLPLKPTEEDLE